MTEEAAINVLKYFIKEYDKIFMIGVVSAEVLDIVIEAIKTILPLIEEDET